MRAADSFQKWLSPWKILHCVKHSFCLMVLLIQLQLVGSTIFLSLFLSLSFANRKNWRLLCSTCFIVCEVETFAGLAIDDSGPNDFMSQVIDLLTSLYRLE
jgi:hypothetical protein